MDPSMSSVVDGSVEKFLHIPYNQRWEYLKDTIINIYEATDGTMQKVEQEMKEKYSFQANKKQYKYHLGKWGIKKNVVAREKDAAIVAMAKRRLPPAASTPSVVITEGDFAKVMENKKIKRYAQESIRKREQLTWTPGLFIQYDLPFTALFPRRNGGGIPSPSIVGPVTPDNMTMGSPQEGVSPPAPHNSMSYVHRKVYLDRARLFLGDRKQDMLNQLNRNEKKQIATWLHDFWMFSFMTVKYWGKGPVTWDMKTINERSFLGQPIPPTPGQGIPLVDASNSPSSMESIPQPEGPSQLCRWSIHYRDSTRYQRAPSPPLQSPNGSEKPFNIGDDSTWTQWNIGEGRDLAGTIRGGLRRNEFSAIKPSNLPLDAGLIVNTIDRSSDEIEAEALGFAIRARNIDVVKGILFCYDREPKIVSAIFPFHLAARFLDGAKTCCSIMEILIERLDESMSIGANYTDGSGLTILDTLFITIIRSHSTTSPQTLGKAFAGQTRYQGQDIDPCGRWDADSPCIRHLHASGKSAIPPEWKHMFCHTSVQAINHFIATMFGRSWRPNINTPSGLFLMQCDCGLELKIGPLHALVLTAYCLAKNGMPEENLFGMIACLVCLLTYRADSCAVAKVSVSMILGHSSENACRHPEINAAELACALFEANEGTWTDAIELGWKILIAILQQDVALRRDNPFVYDGSQNDSDSEEDGDSEDDDSENEEDYANDCDKWDHYDDDGDGGPVRVVYCGNEKLGIIWAVIQAELLTYRRVNEGDPWLSSRFDMEMLLKGLESDDSTDLKWLAGEGRGKTGHMLQEYSRCGIFVKTRDLIPPKREEACTTYYGNLDVYERTTFLTTQYY